MKGCLKRWVLGGWSGVALGIVVLLGMSHVGLGQSTSGTISGRVLDASGQSVAGATITLINQLTGEKRVTKTDSFGEFVFAAVQPATFAVSAEAHGFKQFEKRDLKLSASERLSAGNLRLELGAVTQTVNVSAEVTPVQTESAERSALLDNKEISTLMTQGRDVLGLIRLLPGVVKDGGGGSQLGTQSAGTVDGVRGDNNAISIDGTTGNTRGGANFDTPLNMDAVAEVKVLQNSYQSEYGQSSGAIINLTTKSGTQRFHGAAYYYGRNEAFNANSFFNNAASEPRGRNRFNTIGYNVGGPIFIPGKLNRNKDKVFFFFSQERWPTKTTGSLQKFMVPTELERNGDFSQSFDKNGNKVFVADPLLIAQGMKCSAKDQSGCFPGNVIPAGRINPDMQKVMNIFPLPNRPCATPDECRSLNQLNSGAFYNFQILPDRDQPTNQTVLRVDYNVSSKWRMYFRGMEMANENRGLTATANKTPWGIPAYYKTPATNASFNVTYAATPTLVNEFTAGWAGWKELQNFANPGDLDKVSRSALGIGIGQNNPAQNPYDLVPRITNLGSASGGSVFGIGNAPSIDFDNRFPMNNKTGTWEFTEGLTKIWKRHTSKVGVYFQASRYLQRHIGSTFNGNFDFRTNSSNPYDAQYAYANMLLGNYYSYSEGSNAVNYAPHWNILEWYAQDSWKVKSNFSVDYGVRFTYDLPTTLQPGYGAGFSAGRYDSSEVAPLYFAVKYSSLSPEQQQLCRNGAAAVPSRCAENPLDSTDVKPDVAIGTYVGPFSYTGTVINTDPSYPHSLRKSNGVLYAPRLGLAWDPFHNGKTVIRAGGGIYYNTREGGGTVGDYSLIAPLVSNASVNYGNVATFTPNCGSAAGGCTGVGLINSPQQTRVLQLDRNIESTISASLGVQRNIGFSTVVDVAYVGTFGRHMNQQVDLNKVPYLSQFDPANLDMTVGTKKFFDPNKREQVVQQPAVNDNFFRPIPGYASVNLREYGGTSNYNSLQVAANRRFTKGLQFGVSYTWSKAMAYADNVNGGVATYQDRRWWNYSLANFDRTHNLVVHWVANIPNASRLWHNGLMKAIGDNWEYSGIAEFVSGAPISYSTKGISEAATIDAGGLNLTGGGDGARLILLGNPYAPKNQVHNTLEFIDKNMFALPPVGVIPGPDMAGITGNVLFRGPGTNNWDMALQKNIPIRERMGFSVRLEAYNAFNHVSFDEVDTTARFDTSSNCGPTSAPTCGTGLPTASSTFGQVIGERGPRILQLSARFTF